MEEGKRGGVSKEEGGDPHPLASERCFSTTRIGPSQRDRRDRDLSLLGKESGVANSGREESRGEGNAKRPGQERNPSRPKGPKVFEGKKREVRMMPRKYEGLTSLEPGIDPWSSARRGGKSLIKDAIP